MQTENLHQLTALEIVRGTATGELSVEQVARACLARIARRNPVVHAWETIDSDAVLSRNANESALT